MKTFILLIGASNSGKSTVIQSLTGCKSRTADSGYVVDYSTGRKIYVIVSSPQESP
jgi:GTP-binding protein EngB required for normal cell division